ncbi:MAG TPA: hypothetical protein VNL16_09525 [Chloroflexota bacterium]|nr:hypothetical protein [Chloroflexota bacterium]
MNATRANRGTVLAAALAFAGGLAVGILISAFVVEPLGLTGRPPISCTDATGKIAPGVREAFIRLDNTLTYPAYRCFGPDADGAQWVVLSYGVGGRERAAEYYVSRNGTVVPADQNAVFLMTVANRSVP